MKKIKLTQLESNQLNEKEMTNTHGGVQVACLCMLFDDQTTDAAYSPATTSAPGPGPGTGNPGKPGLVCRCYAEGPEASAAPYHYSF